VTEISIFRAHCYNSRHKRGKLCVLTFRVCTQSLERALTVWISWVQNVRNCFIWDILLCARYSVQQYLHWGNISRTILKTFRRKNIWSYCSKPTSGICYTRHVHYTYWSFMLIIPCIVNQFLKSSNKMTLLYSILLFPASRSAGFGCNIHPSSGARLNCIYVIWF
jgi:hypothetical protein